MKKIVLIFLIALSISAYCDIKFIPIIDADLRVGYSSVTGSNGSASGVGSLFLMPAFKFDESDYLLPIYSFNFSASEFVIEEETLFLRRMNNLLSTGYKHKFSKEIETKVSLDGRYNLNVETKDESFGKGLYDLYDIGGSVSSAYNLFLDEKPFPISLGVKYYQRKYPNYKSLDSTVVEGKEEKPKDFNAINISSGWKYKFSEIYSDLSYNLLIKDYLDSYSRTDQGLISDTKRKDIAHYLDLSLGTPLSETTTAGLDSNLTYYSSNVDLYDTNKLIPLPNYYTYLSISFKPYITFTMGDLNLGVFYSILIRSYKDRKASESDGSYLADSQKDMENTLGLSLKYPIMQQLNAVAGISYLVSDSNMKYQEYIKYNYRILNVSVGVSYSY
ncbi:MAG: hypothetical protein ABH873_03305 [Candidatus Firestonebacteria bacterium]